MIKVSDKHCEHMEHFKISANCDFLPRIRVFPILKLVIPQSWQVSNREQFGIIHTNIEFQSNRPTLMFSNVVWISDYRCICKHSIHAEFYLFIGKFLQALQYIKTSSNEKGILHYNKTEDTPYHLPHSMHLTVNQTTHLCEEHTANSFPN